MNSQTQQPDDAALAACFVRLLQLAYPLPPTERLPELLTAWHRELAQTLGEAPLPESLRQPLDDVERRLLAAARDRDEAERAAAWQLEQRKLESLAEFAAGAGHEINNPVATISGRVQLLLKEERDPERRQALLSIGGQALRIRDMIGDLMLYGRPPEPRPEALDLTVAIGTAVAAFQDQAAAQSCEIRVECAGPAPIWADRAQLSVVIGALLRNSLEAQTEGGVVIVAGTPRLEAGRQWAVLTVSDSGPGLSETDRAHLFDPFYSGRQAGRGLGFGLPKAWRIVNNHGGRIEVESAPQERTTFTVIWPADEAAHSA